MDKLKYLGNLPPDKFIRIGMMVIISFLVTALATSEFNYAKYRTKEEDLKVKMEIDCSSRVVDVYSKYLELQIKRGDSMDAKINEANKAIQEVLKTINKKQ